jgi:hypothetical protein
MSGNQPVEAMIPSYLREDRSVLRRQPADHPVHVVPIRHVDGEVAFGRGLDDQLPHPWRTSGGASRLCVAGPHEQAMKPRLEPIRVAQLGKIAPGDEECLLDGILRPLDVADDAERNRVAAIALEVDELAEGSMVSSAGPLDQPHAHLRPPGRPSLGCLGLYIGGGNASQVQTSRSDVLGCVNR